MGRHPSSVNRVVAVVVTLVVVAGSVPAAAALTSDAQSTVGDGPEPGATFAGVIGVQEAEVDGEISQRAFAREFAAAASNESKAQVIVRRSQRLRQRLDELEAQKARLERAHENGSVGQAAYRARLAALAAGIRAVERQADRTASAAESLPEPALRAHGANVSEVRSIARQANRTGGGAVAEAAREIAGEAVGNGLGPPESVGGGPPDGVGPPDGEEPEPPEGVGPPDGEGSEGGPPESGPDNDDDENETEDGPLDTPNVTVTPPDDGNEGEGIGNGTSPGEGAGRGTGDDHPRNGNESNETGTDVLGTERPDAGEGDDGDSSDGEGDDDDGESDDGTETPRRPPRTPRAP